MKISFKGDYALKVILDLALTSDQGITPIREISRRQDIPERFLEQIITTLKRGNFVKTVRGQRGGVYLAKPPSKITVGEVIRLVEGPTSPITCVSRSGYAHCDFEGRCALRGVFAEVRDRINEVVDTVTFQDLVEKTKKLETRDVLDYCI